MVKNKAFLIKIKEFLRFIEEFCSFLSVFFVAFLGVVANGNTSNLLYIAKTKLEVVGEKWEIYWVNWILGGVCEWKC